MRYAKRALMLIALTLVAGAAFATPAAAGVSFEFFYSNLSHDGQWLVSASYGRVWQPVLYRPGWNPYYDGHWVYTDFGWTWVSDYAWGSIPYHYGTWAFEPGLGWVWVPGYVWAPSWVVFSYGPDYIGWAPVPARYSIGMSIGHGYCSPDHYVFVDSRHFLAPRVRGYAVPVSRNRGLVEHTRIANNIRVENQVVVNHGPSVREVERWSGERIAVRSIERVPRVAAGGRFSRDDVRVDSGRLSRGVRAAEPVATSRQLPGRTRGTERIDSPRGRSGAVAAPRDTDRAPQSVRPGRGVGAAEPKAASRPQSGRGNERVDTSRRRSDAVGATPRSTDRAPQSVRPGRGVGAAEPKATSRPQSGRGNERVDTPRRRSDAVGAAPRSTDRAPQSVRPSRGVGAAEPKATSRPQSGRGNERVDTSRRRSDAVGAAPRSTDRTPQSVRPSRGAAKEQPRARTAESQRGKAKANDKAQGKTRGNTRDRGRGDRGR